MRVTRLTASVMAMAGFALAPQAMADADAPTVWFQATGGYSIYKSELVQSNDTAVTTSYGLGVYAGSEQTVGMYLSKEGSVVPFELNGSEIAVDWQDLHIRYRMGALYLGVVLGTSKWSISAPPDTDDDGTLDADADALSLVDVTTAGYGGNFGVAVPYGKKNDFYLDITYVAPGTNQETLPLNEDGTLAVDAERTLTIGPRTVIDIGTSLAVTRSWLQWVAGFKQRTYTIDLDGTASGEQLNSTYTGVKMNWFF